MGNQSTGIERYVADIDPRNSYDKVLEELTVMVNDLIEKDFDKLISILYRMDVNEQRLKNLLATNPGQLAAKMIATLMLERQLQKIESRERFKGERKGDEEGW